jgi:hypothetical protein
MQAEMMEMAQQAMAAQGEPMEGEAPPPQQMMAAE